MHGSVWDGLHVFGHSLIIFDFHGERVTLPRVLVSGSQLVVTFLVGHRTPTVFIKKLEINAHNFQSLKTQLGQFNMNKSLAIHFFISKKFN